MIRQASRAHNARVLEMLEALRDSAAQGHVIGAAFVILLPRRRFMVEAVGEAERDPVFTRGAVQSLDDLLAEFARSMRDSNTTV